MTEDEAKEKWCPMARIGYSPQGELFDNRQYNFATTQCIASTCMMWRYINPSYVKGTEEDKKLSGYCGLGGKP